MKMAFYNGRSKGAKFVHKAILLLSDPYTHVELIFSDHLSYSSEMKIGPRYKKISYAHPERWHIIDLWWITPEQEARIRKRAELKVALQQAGMIKYDMSGAINCVMTGDHSPWDFFCSETVYDIIAPEIAIPVLNFKMHPQKLMEVICIIEDLEQKTKPDVVRLPTT